MPAVVSTSGSHLLVVGLGCGDRGRILPERIRRTSDKGLCGLPTPTPDAPWLPAPPRTRRPLLSLGDCQSAWVATVSKTHVAVRPRTCIAADAAPCNDSPASPEVTDPKEAAAERQFTGQTRPRKPRPPALGRTRTEDRFVPNDLWRQHRKIHRTSSLNRRDKTGSMQ